MRRFGLIVVMALIAVAAFAQRPAYYKMSGLVREACREGQSQQRVKKLGSAKAPTLVAFVKLSSDNTDVLTSYSCKVLARFGRLCIAEIPLHEIGRLSLDRNIARIEAGRTCTTMIDTSAVITKAVPVWEGEQLPQGYSGEGVVVGVQDIGFDLTHPTFWSSDMSRYRIKAMWDQLSLDTLGSTLPVGRDYVGEDALLEVQHPRDGLIQTHGTLTTGLAAGSGAEGGGNVSKYRGIAYDADICLVCNATSNDASLIAPEDYYKYTYAVDALGFKYIFDYADRVGKPCVINFSEGSRMDFRGDDQLYYEMLDSLVGPGHIIVASAGNLGRDVTYLRKEPSERTKSIAMRRGGNSSVATTRSKGDFTFTFQLSSSNISMSKSIPLSDVLASKDSTLNDSISGNGITCLITATAYRSCFDNSDIICDWSIGHDTSNRSEDSKWSLDLTLAGNGLVEAFPANNVFEHHDGLIYDGDYVYSMNSPASAPCIISAGMTGYRTALTNYQDSVIYPSIYDVSNGARNLCSSVGPTFDERIKPDVMAPGQNVISAFSSFSKGGDSYPAMVRVFSYNDRNYYWGASTGSSLSSPIVTGIIALWLQACPRLTPADCLDIFSKSCAHHDESLSYPNIYYGYGEIDALEGMKVVLEKVANGITDIPQDSSYANGGKSKPESRIYSLDGRCVGTDMSLLHRGLYIRNGKKVVVKD